MRARAILFLITILGLLSANALAQTDTYRLQVQDVVRIEVYNEAQINAVVPVGKDGNISAPFVGTIHAAGRTTAELESDLAILYEEKLKLRTPHVAVTIEQFRAIRASINGMVTTAGVYDFRPGDTVMTLISKGGGINTDRADMRRATLKRGNSRELIPMDLHAMMYLQDMSQNYEIQDGDELNVPEETKNRILVLGAVVAPGPYPYKEPMYLADAVTMAHGPIPIRSMMSRVWIMREIAGKPGQFQRIHADFVKFIRKGDSSQNLELMPGDLIYVSETNTPDLVQISTILTNAIFIFDRIKF